MNVVVLAEGPTDELVLPEFARRILGQPVEVVQRRRRPGGRAEVLRSLVPVLSAAAYQGTTHAIVAIDADDSVRHDQHAGEHDGCDCCWFRQEWSTMCRRQNLAQMRVVFAVPAPALEAWLLPIAHVIKVRPAGPADALPRKEAKRLLYGTVTPTQAEVYNAVGPILKAVDAPAIERLAASQASFRCFRDRVLEWRPDAVDA